MRTTFIFTAKTAIAADATITNTYRGGVGCACGCTGTYSMKPATVRIRTEMINDAIAAGEAVDRLSYQDGSACYSYDYTTPAGQPKSVRIYTQA